MNEDKLRRIDSYLCTRYGAVLLFIGLYLADFDIHRGRIVWSTFLVVILAAFILLAGIGAIYRNRNWPIAAFLGSTMALIVIWKIAKGSPQVFLTPALSPIGFITLITPLLIMTTSLPAFFSNRKSK